jgi:hypothetical protein
MALERRDPLPKGRYSFFVTPTEQGRWDAWLAAHPGVKVIYAIPQKALDSNTAVFATTWTGDILQSYAGATFLFEVFTPIPWVGFGFPDIVTISNAAWLKAERDSLTCYWVWTDAGPSIVCDDKGPASISMTEAAARAIGTFAPWVLAGFFGWLIINRKVPRERGSGNEVPL